MKTRMINQLVALSLLLLPTLCAHARPNIIYINADDLGVMDVGYNSAQFVTPNIDRLAAEGMIFTDGYAPAANCAPSRACVMSGQLSPRHSVYTVGNSDRGKSQSRKLIPIPNTEYLTDEMVVIPEVLNANGYKTIHLGKWHVGKDPLTQGFDANIGGDTSGSPKGGYYLPFQGAMGDFNDAYPQGTHRCDIFADQAIKFMRKNKDQPFFIHMAYYSVHTGLELVPEFEHLYKGKNIHLKYATMVSKMDESIGKILDELDSLGLKENTLVLFSSDNGGICAISSQKPYRAGKGSYFEGGIRVPLAIRWPEKIKAGTRCSTPVIGTDFFPTFLDAANLETPPGKILDGASLLPLLTQSGSFPERNLYWHFPIYLQAYAGEMDESHDPLFRTRPSSVMRKGDWKLHEYFEDGRIELYNLKTDIGERHNLIEQHPEKANELYEQLKKWRAEINAPVPTEPNPQYDPNANAEPKKKNKQK